MTKRVPILDQINEWGRGDHPHASKPLTAFQSITAICDDCGHTAVLGREKLANMPDVPSFGELWRHAYCAQCRLAGASSRNIMMHGLLIDRPVEPSAPRRLDRSDPTPQLPRRSIFNRRSPASQERMIR